MPKILTILTAIITRAPALALVLLTLGTIVAGVFAVTQFRVNADQASLIAPDSAFQQQFSEFRSAFPAYRRTSLVVVEAASPIAAADAATQLAEALSERTDIFQSVFAPSALPFFQQNGLLFLTPDEVSTRLDELVQAQPAIATLARDKGLEGVLSLLRQGATQLDETGAPNPALLTLAAALTNAAHKLEQAPGSTPRISLGNLSSDAQTTAIELITVRIREDKTDILSPRAKLNVIRATARDLGLTPQNGITIRLTGNVPLSVDELAQVRDSLGLAGTMSLLFLALVLGVGVRSGRIVAVMILALAVGGIWSMAWAMASVGEVNLLSASFAVLFVGLGIDFAIHYALRTQEDVENGMPTAQALTTAAGDVGPAIALGALTSTIGFLSFLPTDYRGFADLGVIAGGGMAMAFLAAFTIIPAILAKTGIPATRAAGSSFSGATRWLFTLAQRHARRVAQFVFLATVISAAIATQAQFDFSTLALKNNRSEPILALADLQDRGLVTDYAAYVVAPTIEDAPAIADKLLALSSVSTVRTVQNLIPTQQQEKLDLIDDTAFVFFPIISQLTNPPAALPASLNIALPDNANVVTRSAFAALNQSLAALSPKDLSRLNAVLAAQITRDLVRMTDIFNAQPIQSLEQVPQQLRDRFVSASGKALVVGLPAHDLTVTSNLRTFATEVNNAFPESTGRAVVEAKVGDVVVNAFLTALMLALAAVTTLILLATRNLVDTILILTPLLLAALATTATGVLIGLPFNQANIIVLPLIMGLGVDNGIHLLTRYRADGSLENLVNSSTPRAIVLSTLTTIGAFGALSISTHAGTASMGILLTIAMAYLLVATIFVLPALLSLRRTAAT